MSVPPIYGAAQCCKTRILRHLCLAEPRKHGRIERGHRRARPVTRGKPLPYLCVRHGLHAPHPRPPTGCYPQPPSASIVLPSPLCRVPTAVVVIPSATALGECHNSGLLLGARQGAGRRLAHVHHGRAEADGTVPIAAAQDRPCGRPIGAERPAHPFRSRPSTPAILLDVPARVFEVADGIMQQVAVCVDRVISGQMAVSNDLRVFSAGVDLVLGVHLAMRGDFCKQLVM